jgi:predicted transcriptional regulator
MLYIKKNHIQCNELVFLNSFLASGFLDTINKKPNLEVSLIQEPYTGFGYADLVCLIWDKSVKNSWTKKRNALETRDIKILHHLYCCKKFKEINEIILELGFSKKEVKISIERLLEANLINENKKSKIKIKPLKEIFFIREIISIEAKLRDWKRALEQSINNTYFSSKSFTLFPENIVNENLVENYSLTDVGIITYGEETKILKKPKRQSIPSTLGSWFFNEYIGREIWETTQTK